MTVTEIKRKAIRFFTEQVDWVERAISDFVGGGVIAEGLSIIIVGVGWFAALFFLIWILKKLS